MIFRKDRRLDLKDSVAVGEMTVASFKSYFIVASLSPMKQALFRTPVKEQKVTGFWLCNVKAFLVSGSYIRCFQPPDPPTPHTLKPFLNLFYFSYEKVKDSKRKSKYFFKADLFFPPSPLNPAIKKQWFLWGLFYSLGIPLYIDTAKWNIVV